MDKDKTWRAKEKWLWRAMEKEVWKPLIRKMERELTSGRWAVLSPLPTFQCPIKDTTALVEETVQRLRLAA